MVQLILFYCLFVGYTIFAFYYIRRHYYRYRNESRTYNGEELDIDFRSVTRLLMIITIVVALIGSKLYSSGRGDTAITPGQIGLSLACGTFIFYILFLTWDISKPKVVKFFKEKYNIEIKSKTVFGITIIITISLYAIMLLETVLSIITMVKG